MKKSEKASVQQMASYQLTKKIKKMSPVKKFIPSFSNDENQHEITMIKKIIEKTSDIREEKVATLRKAITKGAYVIHSKKIAERMIKESLFDYYIQMKNQH